MSQNRTTYPPDRFVDPPSTTAESILAPVVPQSATEPPATLSAAEPSEAGKGGEGGEGGVPQASNADELPGANCSIEQADHDVLIPKAHENPVIATLKTRNLYKTPLGSGKHSVNCPWAHEHANKLDTDAVYAEPDENSPVGRFSCSNSHQEIYNTADFLQYLNVQKVKARHTPVIRVVNGELHRIVDAAEQVLAADGRFYQAGGLIVSVKTDPATGDPSIVPATLPAITRILSSAAYWERQDARGEWQPCDPPARHAGILGDSRNYQHLPHLTGVARQPYFRESDGELVMQPGYDPVSQRFGVFNPREFSRPEPTLEAAHSALALLESLLTEFHFLSPTDKAAALSAIFTAVVRPTLALAPAYHYMASVYGSGKTYLCEVTGAFAGPGGNAKVSYPTSSEEATKVILSLLLTNPAVIEFDDMDSDWIPHGVIKRMLTTDQITDRILGVSKTATVSTRVLFMGSGNNVGPVRDLSRRIITIRIDPRCATPATIAYKGDPLQEVRNNRGRYVAAVLTIILAWRKAGSPRTNTNTIVSYDGAWSDYCRHPLMWLGHPDPTTALVEQIKHDPDAEALSGLMAAWFAAFGSKATTVRKAVEAAAYQASDLLDAIREFPVEERGEINRSKLGWLLKKNANRIVNGLEFQKAEADGRTAWRVVKVATPPLPPSPPFTGQLQQGSEEAVVEPQQHGTSTHSLATPDEFSVSVEESGDDQSDIADVADIW